MAARRSANRQATGESGCTADGAVDLPAVDPTPLTEPSNGTLRRIDFVWMSVLVLAGVFTYVRAPQGSFHFDDAAFTSFSQKADSLGDWVDPRAFAHLTFLINRVLFGDNPAAYIAVNIAIHVTAAVVLYLLIRVLQHGRFIPTQSSAFAFAVAGIWCVHPLNSQAIAYVSQRCESLMGLFYLALLLTHTLYVITERKPWLLVACLCFWAGAACKQPIWLAPGVLIFWEWLVLCQNFSALCSRWRTHALYCLPAIVLALYFVPRLISGDATVGGADEAGPWTYLVTQTEVIAHYLGLSLFPSKLCFDYDWPLAKSISDVIPAGLVTVILLTLTIVGVWRRWRIAFLGVWFFAVLAPTSSVLPIADAAVEHRMYLPLIAVIFAFVLACRAVARWIFERSERSVEWLVVAVAICLMVALSVRTHLRIHDYRSDITLWRSVIDVRPDSPRAYSNLTHLLLQERKYQAAFQTAAKCLQLENFREMHRKALGPALSRHGVAEQAIRIFRQAEVDESDLSSVYYHLGLACDAAGERALAVLYIQQALGKAPERDSYRVTLAALLGELGQFDAAANELNQVLARNPRHDEALCNLGILAAMQADWSEARKHLTAAIAINPANSAAQQALNRVREEIRGSGR